MFNFQTKKEESKQMIQIRKEPKAKIKINKPYDIKQRQKTKKENKTNAFQVVTKTKNIETRKKS